MFPFICGRFEPSQMNSIQHKKTKLYEQKTVIIPSMLFYIHTDVLFSIFIFILKWHPCILFSSDPL
jgi:SPX domain protein involved in polyphosphate accumulation